MNCLTVTKTVNINHIRILSSWRYSWSPEPNRHFKKIDRYGVLVKSIPLTPPTPRFLYTCTQVWPSGESLKNYVAILWVQVLQLWTTVRCFGLPHYEPTVVIGGISSNLQRLKSCFPESSDRKRRGNLSNKTDLVYITRLSVVATKLLKIA